MSPRNSQKEGHTIGIDVGGTKVYTILINSNNEILARKKKKTREGTPQNLLDKISRLLDELLDEAGVQLDQVSGIGVGFPGPLEPDTGIVLEATNLPGWDHFPLAAEISKIVSDLPVFLDNDVNVGTLGEALAGAGRGASNVVGIFLGTGVGGGLVFNRRLYHGTSGTAGEVGHMIIQYGGRPSPRNLTGSVEGLTSRTAIVDQIREAIHNGEPCILEPQVKAGKKIRSSALAKALAADDPLVTRIFRQTAEYVGVAIGSLINLLAPDVVVLGGGVIEAAASAVLPTARSVAQRIAVPGAWQSVSIREAVLGDDAGAMGAALLARQRIGAEEPQR